MLQSRKVLKQNRTFKNDLCNFEVLILFLTTSDFCIKINKDVLNYENLMQ